MQILKAYGYFYMTHFYKGLRYFTIIFFLLFSFLAQGQSLKGVITNTENGKPVPTVNITNLNSGHTFYGSEQGIFLAEAASGDVLEFSAVGYKTVRRLTPAAIGVAQMHVEMSQNSIQLDEFVLRDKTPYQKDSAEMAELYNKELHVERIKPQFSSTGSGVGVNGLIGSAVQKISRGYKKSKKFKAEFQKLEEDKFIDTRYTPALVTSLTNIPTGDTLATFMNQYPMDYDFARHASDLELKMWIRDNYKQYMNKKNSEEHTSAKVEQ